MKRILNTKGQIEFRDWVIELHKNPKSDIDIPLELCDQEDTSYAVPNMPNFEDRTFMSKFEFAEYIYEKIKYIEIQKLIKHEEWSFLWDTLALKYFKSLCPKKGEKWMPKREAHYIFDTRSKVMPLKYRHRVYGPVTLYSKSPESVKPFFENVPPSHLGEYEEFCGSKGEFTRNPLMLKLTKHLYLSKDGSLIKGWTTSRKKFPGANVKYPKEGTVRRVVAVCGQLMRTYDLYDIPLDALLEILPAEFNGWLEQ